MTCNALNILLVILFFRWQATGYQSVIKKFAVNSITAFRLIRKILNSIIFW